MTKIEILNDIDAEIVRFTKKLRLAIKETKDPTIYSRKSYASAKRAALDLKNELTKLTQDSKLIWGRD